jgi:hypothetical protein
MKPTMRLRRGTAALAALAAALLQAACTSIPTTTPTPGAAVASAAVPVPGPRAASPQPGRSTTADLLALWGEPRSRTVFAQGHQIWHYYHPRDGWALSSWLPGMHLVASERGRRSIEHVMLFDARGLLVQSLTRELP